MRAHLAVASCQQLEAPDDPEVLAVASDLRYGFPLVFFLHSLSSLMSGLLNIIVPRILHSCRRSVHLTLGFFILCCPLTCVATFTDDHEIGCCKNGMEEASASCSPIWGLILAGRPTGCIMCYPDLSGRRRKATLGGLVPGRQIVPHDRFTGHHRLYIDYFCDDHIYRDGVFHQQLFFPIFIHPLCYNSYGDDVS
jgi:hypothetical protein